MAAFIWDGMKGLASGVGTAAGCVVKGFCDTTGITAAAVAVKEGAEEVSRRTDMATRQALANITDLGERTITNATALGLIATNQATAFCNRGMREVQVWGQFLRGHLVTSSTFAAGLATEGTAVYMHRAHNEFCENSVTAPCAELSTMTVMMYRTGLVCMIVSGTYLFYILHANGRLDQRPTPTVIQKPTVNHNVAPSLNPTHIVDAALVRGILNSEATVEVTRSTLQASVTDNNGVEIEDDWAEQDRQIELALASSKKRR